MTNYRKPSYKYCFVPKCKNTSKNAPHKLFFLVPRGISIRKRWCKILKRNMVSPSSFLHCCEDHFNVEEDTENYEQHKIICSQGKQKNTLRLKKGILPHKFNNQKSTKPQPLPERKELLKNEPTRLLGDAISSPPAQKTISTLKITESSLNYCLEAGTGSSSLYIHPEDTKNNIRSEAACSTSIPNTPATSAHTILAPSTTYFIAQTRQSTASIPPTRQNTELIAPTWQNTELIVPTKQNTELIPTRQNSELIVPTRQNSELIVPTRQNTELIAPTRQNTELIPTTKNLQKATSYLLTEDDECLTLAKAYATKLRKLTPQQLMFADKVINDTLLDAQLGLLTKNTYLTHSLTSSITKTSTWNSHFISSENS